MTTDTIPANARTAPDDKARHKEIADIIFHMDDELGQTNRLIRGAMLSLDGINYKPREGMPEEEVDNLLSYASTVLEAALDHHGVLFGQWRTLFRLTREDKADA